jgi:quercetin dioxygenase-like cupin family protein
MELLAGDLEVTPRFGETRLLVGRATLAPGTTLDPHTTSNVELVSVQSGSLRFLASAPGLVVQRGGEESTLPAGQGQLLTGDGTLVPPDTVLGLSVEGTAAAEILMVRQLTDESEEPDPTNELGDAN